MALGIVIQVSQDECIRFDNSCGQNEFSRVTQKYGPPLLPLPAFSLVLPSLFSAILLHRWLISFVVALRLAKAAI